MRKAVFEALLLVLLACVLSSRIDAYPTRAGHCASGAQIGELSGGVHDREGSGSLEDHNFTISFDDVILQPRGEILELVAGKAYDIVFGGSEVFLGFLVRVSGLNGEDMQDSLTVADKESQLLPSTGELTGFASACAENVAGLCHTTREEKYFVLTEFQVDVEAEVLIEVTIVTQDTGAGNGKWFFSSYRVNVRPDIAATDRNKKTDGNGTTLGNLTSDESGTQGNETKDGTNNETMTILEGDSNSTTDAPSEATQDGGNSTTDAPSETPQDDGNSTSDSPSETLQDDGNSTTDAPSETPQDDGNSTSDSPSETLQDDGNSTTDTPSEAPQDGDNTTSDIPSGSSPVESDTTDAPSILSVGAEVPANAPSDESAPSLPGCKWFCAISTTIPWKSSSHSNPKCDWTFSCAACPQCQDSTA